MAADNPQRTTDCVLLIGSRGSGKTTVARALAERLGWAWVDADDLIEEHAGRPIAQIFAEEGETGFRKLEQEVVEQLCQRRGAVVALGGGAVLSVANRRWIMAAGAVVWLTAPTEQLAQRLEADSSTAARRPSLTGRSVLEEIEQVLAQRAPLYQACATLTIDTEGKTPGQIADEIIGVLGLA